MDCDDVILALAGERTLTGGEDEGLQAHLATCEECRELAHGESDDRSWRWVARLPEDAFDDPDLLVLPVVDPIVFVADKQLAAGGMGKITRARDRRLGRDVAIKEVLEPEMRARFEREATITARLQHPAIVPIYEAGTWPNGSAFYTMRLVAGGTLAEAITSAEGQVARLALLPHVVAVTEALAYAHSRHIIHRDLKPQNVLVGEFGETVVIDWGLAKELDHDVDVTTAVHAGAAPDLTLAGSVIGTPCFMPPEQARGDELDERADVFALGAILYNVLAGEPPYWDQPRETSQQLLEAVIARAPTPIGDKAPDAPADLRAIVERAMARDPAARYPTAKQMAEELRRFQAGQLLISRDYRIRDLLARWIRRHKAPVAVGAVAAAALAIIGVIAIVNVTRSRDAERAARVTAEHADAETERSIAGLLEEQGRSELVAGQRERALAYLAEAYRRGRDTPALRHLLAEATRDLDLLASTLHAPGNPALGDPGYRALAFLPDNRLAVWLEGIDHDSRLELGDGTSVAQTFPLGNAITGQFSPSGKRLVTTMMNEPTRMWDVTTGKQLWQVDGDIDGVSFDLESDRVALFPVHEGAQIYDVDSGKKLLAIDPKYKVTSVAFDASGGVLATIGDGGLCTFFAENKDKHGWTEVPFGNTGFDFRDAGFLAQRTDDRLVMTTKQREVLLWTLDKPFHAIGGHRADITTIGVATKRRVFATADTSGEVKLWAYTGALLGENADAHQAIRTLMFSHDASLLAGIGDDPHVFVWNSALGLRGTLLAPGDEFESVTAIAIAPDDSRIAAIDETGDRIRVWRPPHANLVAHHRSTQVAVGDHAIAVVADTQLVVLDAASGTVTRQLVLAKPALPLARGVADIDRPHLAITADATRALVITSEGASVYDLQAARLIRALPRAATNDGDATTWALSASGHRVVELGDKRIRVHEIDGGGTSVDVDAGDQRGGALSPDETRLVQAGTKPRAWHVPGGAPIALPELAVDKTKTTTEPNDLVFAGDGKRVVVLGTNTPLVVDATTGTIVARLALTPLGDNVQTAKLDAGGHRVVTQVAQLAVVWNADTGAMAFQVPNTAERAVAITPDGARIATGGEDGTVRIWDATGRLLEQIHGHRRAITALDFTPDGTRLIAQGAEQETTIWDVHLEQRSPAAIATIAAQATPWKVLGGQLVLRKAR